GCSMSSPAADLPRNLEVRLALGGDLRQAVKEPVDGDVESMVFGAAHRARPVFGVPQPPARCARNQGLLGRRIRVCADGCARAGWLNRRTKGGKRWRPSGQL